MGRRRAALLGIIVVVFTTIGIGMLGSPEPGRRLSGVLEIAFFGLLGGAATLAELLPRPPMPGVHRMTTLPNGSTVDSIAVDTWPGRLRLLALGVGGACLLALVVAAAPAWLDTGMPIVVRVGIAAISILLLGRLVGRVRTAGTDPDGISFTQAGLQARLGGTRTFVPWSAVESAGAASISGQPMIRVTVDDESRIVRTVGRLAGLTGMLNSSMFGARNVLISASGFGVPVPSILEAIFQVGLAHQVGGPVDVLHVPAVVALTQPVPPRSS